MKKAVRDGTGHILPEGEELPKLNIDLLAQCAEWVESQPQADQAIVPAWNQHIWAAYVHGMNVVNKRSGGYEVVRENYCGSAYCVCGYGMMISGNTITVGEVIDTGNSMVAAQACLAAGIVPDSDNLRRDHTRRQELIRPDAVGFDGNLIQSDAEYGDIDWRTAGEAVFGLTPWEASYLFAGDRSAEEIMEVSQAIAESRGLSLK